MIRPGAGLNGRSVLAVLSHNMLLTCRLILFTINTIATPAAMPLAVHGQVLKISTPEMFGAKGDGMSDDRAAIQACLDAKASKYIFKPGAIYRIGSPVEIKYSGTEIEGNNATLKPASTFAPDSAMLLVTGNTTAKYTSPVEISLKKGLATLLLPNASDILRVGDIVRFEGGVKYNVDNAVYKYGHLAQIQAVSGQTITLTQAPVESFPVNRIYTYSSLKNIKVRNLNVDLDSNAVYGGVALSYCVNSMIRGGKYEGSGTGQTAIRIDQCFNSEVSKTTIANFSKLQGSGPTAYGIAIHGHNIVVRQNQISNCKHALTTSDRRYMSTQLVFQGNVCRGLPIDHNTAPLDFHANARGKAVSNMVYSFSVIGMQVRDGGIDLIGNTVHVDWKGRSEVLCGIFFYENYFGDNKIVNNKIVFKHTNNPKSVEIMKTDRRSNVRSRNVVISGNSSNEGFINWARSDDGIVANNTFNSEYGDLEKSINRPGIELSDCTNFVIQRNSVVNNHSQPTIAAFYVRKDCRNITAECNTIKLKNNIETPMLHLSGYETRAMDNTVISNANFNGYIDGYSDSTKIILIRNKKIDSNGKSSSIGYTTLPSPTKFFEGITVLLTTKSSTDRYLCKRKGKGFEWVKLNKR